MGSMMGCCKSEPVSELADQAGTQLGNSLLEKGKEKADQTGTKLLNRVESTFDDTMDKMINKKLLEKCDSTFNDTVDVFIDQTFQKAMEKFKSPRPLRNERKNGEEMDDMNDPKYKCKKMRANATKKLIAWGLPPLLIDTMDEQGWMDEDNWNVLTKAELQRMQFGNGHIELFMKGMREKKKSQDAAKDEKEKSQDEDDPIKILQRWGIPSNLVDKMKEVGWTSPEYWDDLLEHEFELEDIGFKNGHISTFKRKFQSWKEEQDTKQTERKFHLLRKLEKQPKRHSSILKRNIDVENDTDLDVKVRIIGERKYGSMESNSKAASQSKDSELARSSEDAMSSKQRSKTEDHADASYNKSTDKKMNLGLEATTGIPQVGSVKGSLALAKTSNTSTNATTDSLAEKEREAQARSKKQRSQKDAEANAESSSNVSHHQWQKVEVGFTEIMPNQTIVFPVQIDDPNAVVYMTIYVPKEDRNVCENVQIDANFIKIEKVKFGNDYRIKWKHAIKRPSQPLGKHIQHDVDELKRNRRREEISIKEICKFMNDNGIEDHVADFIECTVGAKDTYLLKDEKVDFGIADFVPQSQALSMSEMDQMRDHIKKAVQLYQLRHVEKAESVEQTRESVEERRMEDEDEERKLSDWERKWQDETRKKEDEERKLDEWWKTTDVHRLMERYITIKNTHLKLKEAQQEQRQHRARKRAIKNQKFQTDKHIDRDSDDEELEQIKKFYPVDGYSLLKRWELEQFYERMVDEGWKNPLDWVHLDDHTMRQNLGFRQGHISIFNRKFDGWVKKYNEIRKTIPSRKKGRDGILIVGPGETKVLKSNYDYRFTKIIVRTGGTLTVEPWGPARKGRRGGVLFIVCWNEVVLEKNATIDVSGCGFWGSKRPKHFGSTPPKCFGGGGSVCEDAWENGAGGGGYGTAGFPGRLVSWGMDMRDQIPENQELNAGAGNMPRQLSDDEDVKFSESQSNLGREDANDWLGGGGKTYGTPKIKSLDVNYGASQGTKEKKEGDWEADHTAKIMAVKKHSGALGSGGGFHSIPKEKRKAVIEEKGWKYPPQSRGGTGGGAIKILCNALWMNQGSSIRADGWFDRNGYELSGGGSGGSIWLTVWKELWTYNENLLYSEMEVQSPCLSARGGGMKAWETDMEEYGKGDEKGIGIGGYGRIRVDYHSVYSLTFDKCAPLPVIGNAPADGAAPSDEKDDGKGSLWQSAV